MRRPGRNAICTSNDIPAGVPGITTDMAARRRRGRKSAPQIPPEVPLSSARTAGPIIIHYIIIASIYLYWLIETIKVSVRFFFFSFFIYIFFISYGFLAFTLFRAEYIYIYISCRIYIYIYISLGYFIYMYIYAYMYIFSFFETELDWIVCGDCGMWRSRELKRKKKTEKLKKNKKKI